MSKKNEHRIEYMSVDQLPPWPRNPKKHDVDGICQSLYRFGFVDMPVLDEDRQKLVAGHGRGEAIEMLSKMPEEERIKKYGKALPDRVRTTKDGRWLIPVIRGITFASDTEAEAYIVATNRLTETGGWDEDKLREIFDSLKTSDMDDAFRGIGFTEKDIKALDRAAEASRQQGLTPEEKLGGYTDAAIKSLVLFFDNASYDKMIARLDAIMAHAKCESHTEAMIAAVMLYEQTNGLVVEEAPAPAPEEA